jgi:hypothetical protein
MRTTLDIADPILRDLKRLQSASGKSLGQLVSELLAQALAAGRDRPGSTPFHWHAAPLGPIVDITDKQALERALDADR